MMDLVSEEQMTEHRRRHAIAPWGTWFTLDRLPHRNDVTCAASDHAPDGAYYVSMTFLGLDPRNAQQMASVIISVPSIMTFLQGVVNVLQAPELAQVSAALAAVTTINGQQVMRNGEQHPE